MRCTIVELSTATLVTDAFAILAAVAGFHLAFRQRLVRSLWTRLFPPRTARPERPPEDDPVHYGLIIAGVMLMAFGILMFSFTTLLDLMMD